MKSPAYYHSANVEDRRQENAMPKTYFPLSKWEWEHCEGMPWSNIHSLGLVPAMGKDGSAITGYLGRSVPFYAIQQGVPMPDPNDSKRFCIVSECGVWGYGGIGNPIDIKPEVAERIKDFSLGTVLGAEVFGNESLIVEAGAEIGRTLFALRISLEPSDQCSNGIQPGEDIRTFLLRCAAMPFVNVYDYQRR